MKKVLLWLVLTAALAVGGYLAYSYYYDHKMPNFRAGTELYVYPGMSVDAVCDSLIARGKVISARSLRRSMLAEGINVPEPGHYTLDGKVSSVYAARMLKKGWQTPVKLSLSGSIRSRRALARKMGAQLLVDSDSLAAAFDDPAFLSRYGVDTTRFFTLILPDTYQVMWTDGPDALMERFVHAHKDYWTEERVAKARRQGLTVEEASILASIVDGETKYEPEMPRIAGVYLNRLRQGMKLQADPTVAWCYGYSLNRILKRHLEVDSPYNTYKYAGLPPGPISCPPKACIEAVLNPDKHGELYFCASPDFDGSHRFARTYSEHQVNARAFQNELTRRQKAAQQ